MDIPDARDQTLRDAKRLDPRIACDDGGLSGCFADLGESAFLGCGRLASMAFPDALQTIGDECILWVQSFGLGGPPGVDAHRQSCISNILQFAS